MFGQYGKDHKIEADEVHVVRMNTDENGVSRYDIKLGQAAELMFSACIENEGRRKGFAIELDDVIIKGSRFLIDTKIMEAFEKKVPESMELIPQLFANNGSVVSFYAMADKPMKEIFFNAIARIIKYGRKQFGELVSIGNDMKIGIELPREIKVKGYWNGTIVSPKEIIYHL